MPQLDGWDGYLAGHITCDCKARTRFVAYLNEQPVYCQNCGKTWLVIWEAAFPFQSYGAGAPPGKGDVQEC